MRSAFARTIYELARADARICVLVADISPAGAMEDFRREFPDRFYNLGVCEQSMIGLAAGLAQRGFKPFCYTIATFALFRAYEFIRCDLAYQNLPVTIVGMGAGLSYSTLGGTHQAIEDVAVAMACPNMTVLVPCDPAETTECTRWCAGRGAGGPVYLRIGKAGEPDLTQGAYRAWSPDHARLIWSFAYHQESLVLSYGPIMAEALKLARRVPADVASVSVLAPLSRDLFELASQYSEIIVVEEASGGPLAVELAKALAGRVKSFSLPREFPHTHGTREELLTRAGLTAETILAQL